MGFVIRLVVTFGQVVIILTVTALLLLATVWLVNKLVQFTANQLGVEVTDFFAWLRTKLPKKNKTIKKETEKNV